MIKVIEQGNLKVNSKKNQCFGGLAFSQARPNMTKVIQQANWKANSEEKYCLRGAHPFIGSPKDD